MSSTIPGGSDHEHDHSNNNHSDDHESSAVDLVTGGVNQIQDLRHDILHLRPGDLLRLPSGTASRTTHNSKSSGGSFRVTAVLTMSV